MKSLKSTLYTTVHGSRKSVEQLADELGISPSYLYRSVLEGESGCRFPVDLVIPLMNAAQDFAVLDHLNARAGRVTAALPRVAKLKLKDPHALNEIQKNFAALMGELLGWLDNPRPEQITDLLCRIHTHLCEVAALRKAVETFQQREIF